jgi:DNA (cytosine-5)-methyltransferase 1
VLRKNFGSDSLIYGDIREVTVERVIKDTELARLEGSEKKQQNWESGKRDKMGEGLGATDTIPVDLLTGGFPCQPFSAAGKRKGTSDNRFLWPEMLRIIREFKPTWVIGENVAGLLSMAEPIGETTMGSQADLFGNRTDTKIERGRGILYRIIGELEQISYAVQVFLIPAASVGAPHQRQRIWVVAHSEIERSVGGSKAVCGTQRRQDDELLPEPDDADRHAADAEGQGLEGRNTTRNGCARGWDTEYTWADSWLEVATRLCRVDDGLPAGVHGLELSKSKHREERLKALGNAIVPQVAMEIMKAIKLASN